MLSTNGCAARTARLRDLCTRRGIDLAVISDAKDIYYFTGFLRPAYGWLVSRVEQFACFNEGDTLLLCGGAMKDAADKARGGRVVTYVDYDIQTTTETYLEHALVPLKHALASCDAVVKRVGIEKRHAQVAVLEMLEDLYPGAEVVDISDAVLGMRLVKDADEIELISRAAELTGLCYETAAGEIAAGKTEIDVYAACCSAYAKAVGNYITLAGDFVSAERAVAIGGPPTRRVLADGESVILDLWVDPDGYWADNARSFIVGGRASREQERLHDLVIEAMERGEKHLVPGIKGADVYREVKKVFDDAGVGEFFPLHAGHGLGLSPHEAPLLIPGSADVLEEGMVCTLEPGLYVPDVGGFRCEDNYVIRAYGPERLTRFSRKVGWR